MYKKLAHKISKECQIHVDSYIQALMENIIMGIDGIFFSIAQVYFDCHYYSQPHICMCILHQRRDTGEVHMTGATSLLEVSGLHVLYTSLAGRTIENFIFLPLKKF